PRKPHENGGSAVCLRSLRFPQLRLQDDADKIEYVCAFALGRFVPKIEKPVTKTKIYRVDR
ncbi:MAG: hypothetical protein ACLU3I_05945, partial [Acutalibacteraceae bacterium]